MLDTVKHVTKWLILKLIIYNWSDCFTDGKILHYINTLLSEIYHIWVLNYWYINSEEVSTEVRE